MTSVTKYYSRGFTLIELLVVIGIIAVLIGLLVPAYSLVTRKANASRVRADLNTIAEALSHYRDDFQGAYPQVVGLNPNVANSQVIGTGAHVLCQALFGLGPAYPNATGQWIGNDGAEGPGFRIRRTLDDGVNQAYTNTAPAVPLGSKTLGDGIPDSFSGKVYGPYLRPESFRFDTEAPFSDLDKVRILDHTGSPILYYSASQPNVNFSSPAAPVLVWAFNPMSAPVVVTPTPAPDPTTHVKTLVTAGNYRPLFNVNDNLHDQFTPLPNDQLNQLQMLIMLGDYDANQLISGNEPTSVSPPFLLWVRGPDGAWGPPAGELAVGAAAAERNRQLVEKCDDITNFR